MTSDIRTYRARSLQEAIALVRQDLGPDASVLHTRKVEVGRLPWTRQRQIEVTASSSIEAPTRFEQREQESLGPELPLPDSGESQARQPHAREPHAPAEAFPTEAYQRETYQPNTDTPSANESPGDASSPGGRRAEQPQAPLWDFDAYRDRVQSVVARDLQSLRADAADRGESRTFDEGSGLDLEGVDAAGLDTIASDIASDTVQADTVQSDTVQSDTVQADAVELDAPASHEKPVDERLFELLVDAEFDEASARVLAADATGELKADASLNTALRELQANLAERLPVAEPFGVDRTRPQTIALVGPTGVGKTTTVAKLAADFSLKQQLRVGLITLDTYRIAAVDQLQTYAEIIDLPMQVAHSSEALATMLHQMRDYDVILLDTAGSSPRDEQRINELRTVLEQAEVEEVCLVLSCTAGGRSNRRAAEQFRAVGASSLILTKLDEADTLGGLFSTLRNGELSIRYLTDGQNVPDDIQNASAERLAERIVRSI